MKRWSLRAQLTLWAALLVAVLLLVVTGGAVVYLRQQELAELDSQFRLIGKHFLSEYRKNGAHPAWVTPRVVKSVIAETKSDEWFIEVLDATGQPLYRSHSLGGRSLAGAPPGISDMAFGANGVRAAVFPGNGVTLYLAVDLSDLNELSSGLLMAVGIVFPLALALIFFGARWLAARALAPIAALTAAAERVTAQCLGEHLPVPPTGDELARLATVLNATFDRLAAAFTQASRFSADASHELKTPLTIARAALEQQLAAPASDQENIATALEQIRRVTQITQTLLLLSRADGGQLDLHPAEGDLAALVRACTEDAQTAAEPRRISILAEVPASQSARFDTGRTTLVLQNLFENAVKHNHDRGHITVGLKPLNGTLAVEIANTGPGIPAEHRAGLFARFFRAAATAETPGHGLGLSLARELARAQGGDVTLGPANDVWTAFVFTVPAA